MIDVSSLFYTLHNFLLTVRSHAHGETFLQSAVLTSVPVMLCHLAFLATATLVAKLFTDRPLEEPLAALATDGSVVTT